MQWLERLDRRWIFVVMGLLVLGPLIKPLYLPLSVTEHVRAFAAAIDRVPNGSTVLMSCDYDPSAIPEMVPMTRTAMRQLLSKDCKIVITVLWNAGRRTRRRRAIHDATKPSAGLCDWAACNVTSTSARWTERSSISAWRSNSAFRCAASSRCIACWGFMAPSALSAVPTRRRSTLSSSD